MPPTPKRRSKVDAVTRWSWLLLLALCLTLFVEFRRLRLETDELRAAAESAVPAPPTAASTTPKLASPHAASTAPAAPSAATPPAKKPTPPPGALASYSDGNVLGDPEYGAAVARRHRRYAMGNYRQAIEAMHLSPADEDRLKQLIVAQWNAREDISDILQRMGNASPELRAKARETAEADALQKLKSFLGDNYDQFEATKEIAAQKQIGWGLATAMWDAGVPLTPVQRDVLAGLQQQIRRQFPEQETPRPTDSDTGLTDADLALLRSAASFLTAEQIAFIQDEKIADVRYRAAVQAIKERKNSAQKSAR